MALVKLFEQANSRIKNFIKDAFKHATMHII